MKEYRDHWEQSIGNKNADWDKQDDRFRIYPNQTVGIGTPQTVMNPAMQTTPVYIPTPFIVLPEIEVGENWFVKLPGCSMVQNVRIVDITEKTVNLNDLNSAKIALGRYKKTDVEFVEKVE